MRDPKLLVDLLQEMDQSPGGRTDAYLTLGNKEALEKHHHAELLVDDGYAAWTDPDKKMRLRITSSGYDFLSAMTKSNHERMKKLKGYLELGMRLVDAVSKIHQSINMIA